MSDKNGRPNRNRRRNAKAPKRTLTLLSLSNIPDDATDEELDRIADEFSRAIGEGMEEEEGK
jgi:hypothetical protein